MHSATDEPLCIVLGDRDPDTGKWIQTGVVKPKQVKSSRTKSKQIKKAKTSSQPRVEWKKLFFQLKEKGRQLWDVREDEIAQQLDEKSMENMNLEAELERKAGELKRVAEENVCLEAEVAEKSEEITNLTTELASVRQAMEAREVWWLCKDFEKDAEANVGSDANNREVIGEAEGAGTNKQVEGKQTNKCGQCHQMFKNNQGLASHMNYCEKKKIKCKDCGYNARKPFLLTQHMKKVHWADTFSCDKCKFTSTSKRRFQVHANAHDGKEIICDVCKKCVSSIKFLRVHKKSVHGLPRFGSGD